MVRKAPLLGFTFNKIACLEPAILLDTNFATSVYLWILPKFQSSFPVENLLAATSQSKSFMLSRKFPIPLCKIENTQFPQNFHVTKLGEIMVFYTVVNCESNVSTTPLIGLKDRVQLNENLLSYVIM